MEKIKLRLILAFSLTIMILLGISISCIYWLQIQDVENEIQTRLSSTKSLYEEYLQQDTCILSAQIDFLKEDKNLQDIWLTKDRGTLLGYTDSIFKRMLSKYNITHFYFHDLDKTCFVRLHNPLQDGDYINRFTLANAALEDKPSSGIELGPMGTFTLRTVHPWHINDKLAGYIELGEEIEHIIVKLTKIFDVGIFVVINKSQLEHTKWEQGLKMLGHKANWDISADFVIISYCQKEVPQEIIKQLEIQKADNKHHLFKITKEDRISKAGFIPLNDVQGKNIGQMIVVQDITAKGVYLRRLILISTIITVLIGLILLALFYVYISRLVSKLKIAYKNMKVEIENRKQAEEDLQKYRKQLEEIVTKRTAQLKIANEQMDHDISELKKERTEKSKLEAQLRQAQKMKAIGTLAGGIAHDFNNILAALIGYIELTLDDLPKKTIAYDNLEQSLICCNRAKDLVKQILTFSRKTEIEKKKIQIDPIVREVLKMLRSSLPTSIDIQQSIEPDPGFILADPTQIHQIILNLCTNAYHAMEEHGGILEVTLMNIDFMTETKVNNQWLKKGSYVRLTVSDTGCGMDEATLERIFEPFYTTKKPGRGTGMGLSVVYGIVKNYGGTITVSSILGKGTIFEIFLPSIHGVISEEVESSQSIPKGTETILLVDDEKSIVDITKQMLERLGYTVFGKTSSTDALDAFCAEPDKYELVITDLTMPDISGEQLARKLLNIRKDIPIILYSGSINIDSEKAKAMGVKEFVIKPVTKEKMAVIIRNILDKKELTV